MGSCKGSACSLQKRALELEKERDTVKGQMDMARNELKKTQDLLKMLTDSKTVPVCQSSLPLNTSKTVL